jgi:hypothetical protein
VCLIRKVLWPKDPPKNGRAVRARLYSLLYSALRTAPQRGRGAYYRRFLEHALKVTRNYSSGLFHCYEDTRIPQTNNDIEAMNGVIKLSLRRCSGKMSTASGPGTSYGRYYALAIVVTICLSESQLDELLSVHDRTAYIHTYRQIRELRQKVGSRRAYLRNPSKYLQEFIDGVAGRLNMD